MYWIKSPFGDGVNKTISHYRKYDEEKMTTREILINKTLHTKLKTDRYLPRKKSIK